MESQKERKNKMLNFSDMLQIAVLGFFTGFGSTCGIEISKYVAEQIKNKTEKLREKS